MFHLLRSISSVSYKVDLKVLSFVIFVPSLNAFLLSVAVYYFLKCFYRVDTMKDNRFRFINSNNLCKILNSLDCQSVSI